MGRNGAEIRVGESKVGGLKKVVVVQGDTGEWGPVITGERERERREREREEREL